MDTAKNYLKRLQELLETPLAMASISLQRGRTIRVQDVLAPLEYDVRYPRNARICGKCLTCRLPHE